MDLVIHEVYYDPEERALLQLREVVDGHHAERETFLTSEYCLWYGDASTTKRTRRVTLEVLSRLRPVAVGSDPTVVFHKWKSRTAAEFGPKGDGAWRVAGDMDELEAFRKSRE